MPELPEVQALTVDLSRRLSGRVLDRLDVLAFPALKTYDPPLSVLLGASVTDVSRHGKFLDLHLTTIDNQQLHLLIHLARAGWLRWRNVAPAPMPRGPGKGPMAARLVLDDGSGLDITEAGTKKSLSISLVRRADEVPGVARLGPEPLDDAFTVEVFRDILKRQGRAQIKGVLRNQSTIAGIGNAYSDEILHAAKMSPFKPADMSPDDAARLYAALQSTLRAAVERADGVSASELKGEKKSNLQVHGRNGLPCPVCGDTVRQVIYSDSTFQYCPTCQTGGKPLADRVLSRLLK
ncbi:MAG: DNA-formamidopyrimidine glycosylase family protein [Pseudolysinimonas sp.]